MAAKMIMNNAKYPLGHFLRSSAISAVRIAAIPKPLAEAEALRRSHFDAKAREIVGDGRLWALNSDSFGVQARGSKKVVDDEVEDEDDGGDFDSEDDFSGEVDFSGDEDEFDEDDEFDDDDERR